MGIPGLLTCIECFKSASHVLCRCSKNTCFTFVHGNRPNCFTEGQRYTAAANTLVGQPY